MIMAFEVAFGIMTIITVGLFFAYVRLRKKHDVLQRQHDVLDAQMKVRGEDLPALTEQIHTKASEPMNRMMEDLKGRIENLNEQASRNHEAFTHMSSTTNELAKSTKVISDVLTSSQKRGQYVEIQVERFLQMSGLEKGINYDTQYTTGTKRPDFVVRLSDNRNVIIDSKAPLDALRKAHDTDDEATKSQFMDEHLKMIKSHIKDLSGKEYWKGESDLEYVVMVMPEYAILPALERDADLFEHALKNRVILVSPPVLMLLLRAIEIMWKQTQMSNTVREAQQLSADLYRRLCTFANHYSKTGKELTDTVKRYNESLGSWESRLMPVAERLAHTSASVSDMPDVKPVENSPRDLVVNKDEL